MADEELEWDLKVDADTHGGTQMDGVLKALNNTMNLLNFHLGHIEENTRKVNKKHDEHGHHARGLTGVLERLVHAGMEPFLHKAKEIAEFQFISEMTHHLIALPGELAEEIKHLGEEMLMAAASEERMGIAFKNALGTEDAEKLEHYIDRIREHTEFTKSSLEGMGLALAKSGMHGEALAKGMEAAIDLAAMTTNPEEGASSAIGALQRVMTTGRLDARALRPFGISEKTFFEELAKENGMGIETVKKRMDKGKLDIETTLNSLYTVITRKTGKDLGGAGADMEKTFLARLKNMKEIPELIGEKLKGTKGYEQISGFVERVAEAFDPEGEAGEKIFEGFKNIFDVIGEELKDVDVKAIASGVADALHTVAASIGPVVAGLKAVVHFGKEAFGVFEGVANFFGAKVVGEAIAYANHGGSARGERVGADFDLAKAREELKRRMAAGTFKVDLAAGTAKAEPAFEEAGHKFGTAVEKGFRSKTKTHSPSELFAEIGEDVAAGFASGIDASSARVDAAMARMAAPTISMSGSPGGGGAPVIHLTIQQQNHIHSSEDAEHIADEISEKIQEIVPGALQSALEQMSLQTGSAT